MSPMVFMGFPYIQKFKFLFLHYPLKKVFCRNRSFSAAGSRQGFLQMSNRFVAGLRTQIDRVLAVVQEIEYVRFSREGLAYAGKYLYNFQGLVTAYQTGNNSEYPGRIAIRNLSRGRRVWI